MTNQQDEVLDLVTDIIELVEFDDTETAVEGVGLALALIIFDRGGKRTHCFSVLQHITEKMVGLIDEASTSASVKGQKGNVNELLQQLRRRARR